MTRIHHLYTGVFALIITGVFISFKTTIFQHDGSDNRSYYLGGDDAACGKTAIDLKKFIDKVISDTYKELTEDTDHIYRHMKFDDAEISFDQLKLQDRNTAANLESHEPTADSVEGSRRRKKG
ncbi:hypothetical protein DPMN_143004 [Dreissena polymorpha]|uniref:Uncharacterized protein n=1 Tax=Dreissena polymorpha TaxID=45954 RepID=A0A9D4GIB4_DREPO|nr:hypothetical protein DPMN_143004 [Dreissena polymorpha]